MWLLRVLTTVFETRSTERISSVAETRPCRKACRWSWTTRATAPTTSGALTAEQATIGQTLSLGLTLLAQLAGTPQITINPRYGQWDHTAGRVIAASDVAASIVVAPTG